MIRLAEQKDLADIVNIYNQGILTYYATADEEQTTVEKKQAWFDEHQNPKRPIWVLEDNGEVCAWASLNTFYGRPAYNATVEISLYVKEECQRKGYGRKLMEHIILEAPKRDIKCLLAFIFAHNPGSLKLFQSFKFEQWGLMPNVAYLNEKDCDLIVLGRHL